MKTVAFMRELVAKGLSWEDAALMAEKFEDGIEDAVAKLTPVRSGGAIRQAQYRERQKAKAITSDITSDITDVPEPLSPSLSPPHPPKPTPIPVECVSTRTRKADDFERFWGVYPRKTAKDAARKAWPRAIGRASIDTMLAAIETQRTWDEWQRGFVPHPATWLNQARWTDEPPPETAPPRKAHERPSHLQPAPNSRAARRGVWAEVLAEERGEEFGGLGVGAR